MDAESQNQSPIVSMNPESNPGGKPDQAPPAGGPPYPGFFGSLLNEALAAGRRGWQRYDLPK